MNNQQASAQPQTPQPMTQGDIGLLIAAIGLIGFFATLALDYYLNSYNRRR